MMMPLARCLALLFALPLAACASGSAAPEARPDPAQGAPVSGTYANDHEVMVFEGDDWVAMSAVDELVLIERGDSLFVSFDLVQTNAHLCSYRGTMAREGDQWVRRETIPFYDGDETCTLSLRDSPEAFVLADSANVCRREYCGARASVEGVSFPRGSWTPDTTVSEW